MGRIVDWLLGRPVERVQPLEGTNMSLWNSQIPAFWQETYGTPWYGTPQLTEQVWVADRCQHMNAEQIARMPVIWHGPPVPDSTPHWIKETPDANWYPNGIGDAVYGIVAQLYGWGFSCQYVTEWYATGWPRTWTVLPSASVQIKLVDGRREYKVGEEILDPDRVVQIDRKRQPGQVQGTPALRAYAQAAYGLLAAGNQSMAVTGGGFPAAILKRKAGIFTPEQAEDLKATWRSKAAARGADPIILPPELEYEQLSFNPSDLSLLETQEWNARMIATAYGIPSTMLNMALQGGLTYQNPAALGEQWWRTELRMTAANIAQALSRQMLPADQWISFDAADTFAPITEQSAVDDPQQASQEAAAPTQQPGLAVVAGGTQ